jgi:hypothetical protein
MTAELKISKVLRSAVRVVMLEALRKDLVVMKAEQEEQ